MCHASDSKGSQPHNIQVYRLVLKSLQMRECVKHQNMQVLVKLPRVHYSLAPRNYLDCGLAYRGVRKSLEISYRILSNFGASS